MAGPSAGGAAPSAPGAAPLDAAELPAWARLGQARLACDLDGDGDDEEVSLEAGRLVARGHGAALLETGPEWLVSDALAADFDRDGRAELAFLVWKRGSYGRARPFWEKGADADEALSQHLFLYRSQPGGPMRPVWMSSSLGAHVARMEPAGAPGRPRLRLTELGGRATEWEWGSWGFVLVAGAEPKPGPGGA